MPFFLSDKGRDCILPRIEFLKTDKVRWFIIAKIMAKIRIHSPVTSSQI